MLKRSGYRSVAMMCVVSIICLKEAQPTGHAAEQEPQAHSTVNAAASASIANFQAFRRFACDYTISSGYAADVKSALSDGPSQSVVAETFIWSRDRIAECVRPAADGYQLQSSVSYPRKHNRKKAVSDQEAKGNESVSARDSGSRAPPFKEDSALRNEEFLFRFHPGIGGGTISRAVASESFPSAFTPFSMGITGQGLQNALERLLQDADHIHLDVLESSESVLRVKWSVPGLGPSWYEYVFNPNQGHLLTEVIVAGDGNKENASRVVVTHARDCGNGRWFPIRSVYVSRAFAKTGPYGVRAIKVDRLEIDSEVARSRFEIVVPKGSFINDQRVLGSQVLVNDDRRFGLTDLSSIREATEKALVLAKEDERGIDQVEERTGLTQ